MANNSQVRPNSKALTDGDARHLLAFGLLRACHQHGPSRVALAIGCDEKTVRRARDEESTLGLACSWNLLDVDIHALDAIAAAKDVRIVPLTREKVVSALHEACGREVLIVTSGAEEFLGEAAGPVIDADSPKLPNIGEEYQDAA